MAKRLRRIARRHRRMPRFFRAKSKPKIPLEVAIVGATTPFVPAADGWGTPLAYLQVGDYQGLGMALAKGFTGLDMAGGGFNALSVLNPFDMNAARYTKMLIYAGLASKIRKKFVKIPMNKIPIIGNYIS